MDCGLFPCTQNKIGIYMGETLEIWARRKMAVVSRPPSFPVDTVIEILKRLPAKSLMRFKCVSREWFDIITDPFFAESHANHARTRPDASHILCAFFLPTDTHKLSTIFPANNDLSLSSRLPSHYFSHETQPCSNIANGLVCVCAYDSYTSPTATFSLLNLTTMQKKSLPPPTLVDHGYKKFLLGFNPVSKKYILLHCGKGKSGYEILTFGSKKWRRVQGLVPRKPFRDISVYIDQRIYFQEMLHGGNVQLIYFDLIQEKFQLLAHPGEVKLSFWDIVEIVGKIGIVQKTRNSSLQIWTLEDDCVSWVKQCIVLPNGIYDVKKLTYLPADNPMLLLSCNTKVLPSSYTKHCCYIYDLKTSHCTQTQVTHHSARNHIDALFGRMLSSFCEPLFFITLSESAPFDWLRCHSHNCMNHLLFFFHLFGINPWSHKAGAS